jgi:hypothetical protein
MKKVFLSLLILMSAMALHAQYMYDHNNSNDNDDENNGGFRKDHVFIGGALSLGFGSGSFNIGGTPEVGYSVAQWLDAGVVFNINYFTQTYYDYYGPGQNFKVSNFNYGGGVFMRAYPIPFLFFQIQPEYNWISYNDDINGKSTYSAGSLIGAIGYGQRIVGQGSYFFSIGLDLLRNKYSPYLDGYGNPYPIIRGGFDIYLKPSKKPKPSGPEL